MEMWIVIAAVVVALAVMGAFCAIIFKLLNIVHDMTYVEPVQEQGVRRNAK